MVEAQIRRICRKSIRDEIGKESQKLHLKEPIGQAKEFGLYLRSRRSPEQFPQRDEMGQFAEALRRDWRRAK